ncbi:MAG TPA: GNAT family N-acetyltransferase [Gaiellaceae bacterium]
MREAKTSAQRDDLMPTLYQAEWCPFSSAVREVLTELGVDFVARQVAPWPDERGELRAVGGTDQIPVLQAEDGRLYRGTRGIFAYLHERDPWRFAAAHRRRFADHRDARETDVPGQLIEYFRGTDELEAAAGALSEAEVVDVPEASRFELRLGGRLIGLAAYRRRDGRIALTHTEVDESCEGRGCGSRLAAAALEAARREGLKVVPLCPFIAHYIDKHPEYEELVASGYRDRKGPDAGASGTST